MLKLACGLAKRTLISNVYTNPFRKMLFGNVASSSSETPLDTVLIYLPKPPEKWNIQLG